MNEQMLKERAKEIRKDIVTMIGQAKSGHPGGSLSATEIVTYLYFEELRIDPANPRWDDRDRFILSKGHAAPVLYAALARRGFFPTEELSTLRKIGSHLQGHPDMKKVPGVDMSTGSLGTGFSAATGIAMACKLDKKENYVYTLLGDGEIQEGQVWEAAMTSYKNKLDNLCVIVDNNNLQIDGNIEKVKGLDNIEGKFKAFGFNTIVIDGNNIEQIINALETAKLTKGKPTAIIAKTIKGKGISFMENEASWHGKAPNEEEYNKAIKELE